MPSESVNAICCAVLVVKLLFVLCQCIEVLYFICCINLRLIYLSGLIRLGVGNNAQIFFRATFGLSSNLIQILAFEFEFKKRNEIYI